MLESDEAVDYAYTILPADKQAPESAEALFSAAETGMFTGKTVVLTDHNISGNNSFTLYAAVRTINPYVYSEMATADLDTHFDYTEPVTLDAVTRNSFTYHIKPEGSGMYRHLCIRKADYDWFVSYMQITPEMYVGTFGLRAEGEQSYSFEDAFEDDGGYSVYIYSGTEYMLIYGMTDPSSSFKVPSARYITFRTPDAGEAPYGIDVTVDNVKSMTADIKIVPEEGIVRYRTVVAPTAEFDGAWIEGEASVRALIIGDPSDRAANMSGPNVLNPSGLAPETEYTVGVVGFDENEREKVVFATFDTTPPTGPAPTIEITPRTTDEPWHEVALGVKLQNTVSAWTCLATKAMFDEVLNQPGFTGTMGDIIMNNGTPLTPEQIQKAMSEGVVDRSDQLSPYTEYIYGVYAVNVEKVSAVETYEFRTDAAPKLDLRMELVGDFEASITDTDARPFTFPVTISAGENDALRAEYENKNQLAILGFEPCGVEYRSPQDLLDRGWAATEEEANANYGPKIILQLSSDNTITTGSIDPSSSLLDFVVGAYDGNKWHLKGYARTQSGNIMPTTETFPVEVSDDRATITVKGKPGTVYGSEEVVYYPGIYVGESPWWGGSDLFRGASELVLTRKASVTVRGIVQPRLQGALTLPAYREISVGDDAERLRTERVRSLSDNR